MTGADIAGLIIALGPVALKMIPELQAVWTTQLSTEQVLSICSRSSKTYDEYVNEAKAKLAIPS